ncbi:MAG: hypothetical protein QG599_979 [Pseudomonadota bacterium]|nr:hypothetical protein [Pseudomonadota bacterium]
MRILLDTHIFLWVTMDAPQLTPSARALIQEAHEVYVSAASIWEIAIKSAIGKIEADAEEMAEAIELSGFIELPITSRHTAKVAKLPFLNRHKDPFDRLLVAQSMVEPLVLVTVDPKIVAYGGLTQKI